MKKFFMLACTFVLSFSLFVPFANAASSQFKDVKVSNRFYNEILFLTEENIISGFPDGTFKPSQEVTRAAAAIIIGKALHLDGKKLQTQFTDVPSASIASGYIASAVEKGIISGFPDNTFRPNQSVTRGQMAILLSKAFELTEEEDIHFSDVHSKMAAYPYIKKMTAAGIAAGYEDNTYKPDLVLKREQFAAFMARALNPFFIPGNKVPDLAVSFLNVGQGDATLATFPNGQTLLIDAGPSDAIIKRELEALGIKKINTFIATHPGADHIGGADYVIRTMGVEHVFDAGLPGMDAEFKDYTEAVKTKKLTRQQLQTGQQLSLDPLVKVKVLHANPAAANIDDGSAVIQMTYGDVSYLFTSEAGTAVEEKLMATSAVKADVLKAAKHGSNEATSQKFINTVDPLIAIFSTDGEANDLTADTRARLEANGTEVFSTATGTVVTMSSPEDFYIFQEDPSSVKELNKNTAASLAKSAAVRQIK